MSNDSLPVIVRLIISADAIPRMVRDLLRPKGIEIS
jgi:hypothetical protein